MKRGDLGQPPIGAAGYPDEPGSSASEPAIAGDAPLREQSAADSATRDLTSEDPGDQARAPARAIARPSRPTICSGRLTQRRRSPRKPAGWACSAAP